MDPKAFEAITRAMGSEMTRRGTIARLAGGMAAVVTGVAITSDTLEARKKKRNSRKKGRKKARSTQRSGIAFAQSVSTCPEGCINGNGVTPTPGTGNNDTCEQLGDTGFRFNVPDPATFPINGTYTHSCGCELAWTIYEVDGGWTALKFEPVDGDQLCLVKQLTVKGGAGYNVYDFGEGTTCASNLVSPINASGNPAAISHFDICDGNVSCCSTEQGCDGSCTLGYWVQPQHLCKWPSGITPETPFPCNTNLTYLQALQCRGSAKDNPTCNTRTAQQAAALLNTAYFGCYAYEGDICSASTAGLDAANQHDPDCCATGTCADPAVCTIGRTCNLGNCQA